MIDTIAVRPGDATMLLAYLHCAAMGELPIDADGDYVLPLPTLTILCDRFGRTFLVDVGLAQQAPGGCGTSVCAICKATAGRPLCC